VIKQFVPEDVCLKCRGCCRFSEANSVWLPCLLDEEIVELADKKGIAAVSLSMDKRIMPKVIEGNEGFFCPFLSITDNKCAIYNSRPFECQLYPFLLSLRQKKALLTVDLNCPYVQEKINTPEFKEYTLYLADLLNSPAYLRLLKNNPQIIQAYAQVLDVVELNLPHGIA
jgi:hypothetical protein